MNKYELSKSDFNMIEEAFAAYDNELHSEGVDAVFRSRAEELRIKFNTAHTAWIETAE